MPRPEEKVRSWVVALMPWLLFGLAVRLMVAPFTSHPFDMTSFIAHQDRLFDAGLNPLANWKFSLPLIGILLGTFLPTSLTALAGVPLVLAQQFWIKFPFILADLALAVALGRLVWRTTEDRRLGRLAALAWIFNPTAFFFTAIHGQFDVLPALLVVVSCLLIIADDRASAYAGVLGAGVSKFFGFVLIPVLWIWERERGVGSGSYIRLALVSVGLVGLAFAQLVIPLTRTDFFGGVGSSIISGEQLGQWSVWAHGWTSADFALRAWPFIYLTIYVAVIACVWRRRSAVCRDPMHFTAIAAALLGLLVALDPVANPQFVLWSLPLFMALSFRRRSVPGLLMSVAVGVASVLSLVLVEGSRAWLLNVIPALRDRGIFIPTGVADVEVARNLGFAYGVSLVILSAWALFPVLFPHVRPRRLMSTFAAGMSRSFQAMTQGTLFLGAATIGLLLGFVLHPSIAQHYAAAPDIPWDLERLNTFYPQAVSKGMDNSVLNLRWSDRDIMFLSDRPDKVTVEVLSRKTISPIAWSRGLTTTTPIDDEGEQERVVLSSATDAAEIRLLMNNPNVESVDEATPPKVRVYRGWSGTEVLDADVEIGYQTSPDWYVIRAYFTEAVRAKRLIVHVSAHRDEGWSWAAGEPSDKTTRGIADMKGRKVSHWTEVRSAGTFPSDEVIPKVEWTLDNTVLLHDSFESAETQARFALPTMLRHGVLDARLRIVFEDPWWRRLPFLASAVALLALLVALGYAALTVKAIRWAWPKRAR